MKKTATKKRTAKKPATANGNKPKAIYWTEDMTKNMATIRMHRSDPRLSDSSLVADAMTAYAKQLDRGEIPLD